MSLNFYPQKKKKRKTHSPVGFETVSPWAERNCRQSRRALNNSIKKKALMIKECLNSDFKRNPSNYRFLEIIIPG